MSDSASPVARALHGMPRGPMAVVAVALVALAWLWWPSATSDALLGHSDVLYELHRVQRCLQDFPHVASIDSYSHAGRLDRLPGLAPLTFGLAGLARVLGHGGATTGVRELAMGLALVPPLLGALTAGLVVLLARRIGASPGAAAFAGLLAALSGDAAPVFHHGLVSHDAMTALGIVLAVLARACRSWPAWGAACALLFATTPDATVVVTVLLAVVGSAEAIERIHGGPTDLRGRVVAWCLAPAAAAALALIAARSLDPDPPAWMGDDALAFSALHVAWVAAAGAGAALVIGLTRRGSTRRRRLGLAAALASALAGVLVAGLAATGRLAPVAERVIQRVRRPDGDEMSPLRSLLADPWGHEASWSVLLVLLLVACGVRAVILARRPAASRWPVFAGVLALVGALLGVAERQHARAFAPVIALALALLVSDAARLLARASVRLAGPRGHALAGLAIALPFVHHALGARATLREAPGWPSGVGAACDWMREHLPDAGPRDRVASRAVFGPSDWGHHVNVLGRQPVLVDPSGRIEARDALSRELWLAETPAALVSALDAHRVSHVFSTGAYRSAAAALQSSGQSALARLPSAPGGLAYLGGLERFALVRLEKGGGMLDEAGRLLPAWISSADAPTGILEADGVRQLRVPLARIYEVVPGAEITGVAPGYCEQIVLACEIRDAAGDSVVARRAVPVTDLDGHFRLRTALPAPYATDTYYVPGPCVLQCGAGAFQVFVMERDVREGRRIALE